MKEKFSCNGYKLIFVLLSLLLVTVLCTSCTPARKTALRMVVTVKEPEAKLPAAEAPIPFTLGVRGRSGCLVCHSDKHLTKIVDGKRISLYVSPAEFGKSPHKDILCTSCHRDFTYEVHPVPTAEEYQRVAGLACIRCHDKQYKVYRESIHGKLALAGDPKKGATCGECHGSHDIRSLRVEEQRLKFRAGCKESCGGCHKDGYESYNDYYHGRAYKVGAVDAPTCWDCHGAHDVQPTESDVAKVSGKNIAKTCGICHKGSNESFAGYARMIHKDTEVREQNLVLKIIYAVISFAKRVIIGE